LATCSRGRSSAAGSASATDAAGFLDGLGEDAVVIDDPPRPPGLSPDPDDDYLVALARVAGADYLVSGDRHLLDLADPMPPILTPRQFLDLVQAGGA